MRNDIKLTISLLLMMVVFGTACKKDAQYDVMGDKVNRVYITTSNKSVNSINTLKFTIVNTPAGSVGSVNGALPVNSTMAAKQAITVAFTVDNSLIDQYNQKYGTSYKAVPQGFVTINQNVTIPAGSAISKDSLKVSIAPDKLVQLTDKAYVIPVKISSISGDNNAQVSSNENVVFIAVNISVTQLYNAPVGSDMTGNLIADRSAWTGTIDQPIYAGSVSALFDGDDNSYCYSGVGTLTVDLGSTVSGINGMRFKSYFDAYGINTANVSSSTDGQTWTDYGTATFATGIGAQYVKFYKNINARYLRFQITQSQQSGFIALTEFDVYK
ncbi:BT_3987 domain-containing protein [Mucilaginibacter sp. MD40]|uniref:BT_3987 domain-containing protein n=1 Tax=Mucilaginibacter sp. MD40 TaxID=2029590 RepID=UPI001304726D|nr:DUF1735 domain-containing protein [Mucilaginibacter sp. MD40]